MLTKARHKNRNIQSYLCKIQKQAKLVKGVRRQHSGSLRGEAGRVLDQGEQVLTAFYFLSADYTAGWRGTGLGPVRLPRGRAQRRKGARAAPDTLTSACSAARSGGLRAPTSLRWLGPGRRGQTPDPLACAPLLYSVASASAHNPGELRLATTRLGVRLGPPQASVSGLSARSPRRLSEIPPNLRQGHARVNVTSPRPSRIRLLASSATASESETEDYNSQEVVG
ncbi:uncharacterized protein [Equus przewalskii]|uniref:Uncharacterized protein n=1 Tax=Equus przewalskii TaxID=9798 RepID=A0ABM4PV26_EQUPR